MAKIPFDEKELTIKAYGPNFVDPTAHGAPIFEFPVSPKEALVAAYNKKAIWCPYGIETGVFCPEIIPDNVARGFVFSAESPEYPIERYGGPDMFGVEWVYVPVVGGSMEKPGVPHPMEDASDWKTAIKFPDVDNWDWDASGRKNAEYLKNGLGNMFWFLNGMGFERLISFMGFENAAMALLDDEQEDDLLELLQKLTDLHIKMADHAIETYGDGIVGFCVHDDWGSQKDPFFSEECAEKFFVPGMREFTSHIKAKGMIADLHSCGHIESRIQSIINGGWQSWTPMNMNNTKKLYKEYGDQILLGLVDARDESLSMEEQAKKFVAEYWSPEKPSMIGVYGTDMVMNEEYAKALYKASRTK